MNIKNPSGKVTLRQVLPYQALMEEPMSAGPFLSNAVRAICLPLLSSGLALFAVPHIAFAHDSWISRHQFMDPKTGALCCDERDCSALDESDVKETDEGFVVRGKYFVAHMRVLSSADGNYWACFNSEGKGAHDRKMDVRCFFALMNS